MHWLQYICLFKKKIVGARRHARLVLKKSLFVSDTVEKLFKNSPSLNEGHPNNVAKVHVRLDFWLCKCQQHK